jgi:hypothetical protein
VNRRATPLSYAVEIVAMSWRHGGELAVTVTCVGVIGLMASFSGLRHVLLILMVPTTAALVLHAAVSGWRLYRRQAVAIATTRSLLDSNAQDQADLERHLLNRYRRREARIQERNEARIERLDDEIASLQAGVIERSRSAA